jgi:hypothetical protein
MTLDVCRRNCWLEIIHRVDQVLQAGTVLCRAWAGKDTRSGWRIEENITRRKSTIWSRTGRPPRGGDGHKPIVIDDVGRDASSMKRQTPVASLVWCAGVASGLIALCDEGSTYGS